VLGNKIAAIAVTFMWGVWGSHKKYTWWWPVSASMVCVAGGVGWHLEIPEHAETGCAARGPWWLRPKLLVVVCSWWARGFLTLSHQQYKLIEGLFIAKLLAYKDANKVSS
jgi:hypothetical protein